MYRIILFRLSLFFVIVPITGINANDDLVYRFEYLLIEDGLPQNTITCIEKDKYGYMWFGTNNGICRYDSYTFDLFKSVEGSRNALPDNMITAIESDENEKIWIGTSKGLSHYSHKNGQIELFTDTNSFGVGINRVSSIVAKDDTVWVTTNDFGIFLLKPTKGKYYIEKHYCKENGNLPISQTNTLLITHSGDVIAGTQNGAFKLNKETDTFTRLETSTSGPSETWINDIFEDSKNNLYYGTNNGLFVYHHKQEQVQWFTTDNNNNHALLHGWVNEIKEDLKGRILIASLGGLQIYQPETNNFYSFKEEGPDNFKINNPFINTVFCDENGNVWIGTEKGGINKFNIYQNPFKFLVNDPNNSNSLNKNRINSIYQENNQLWIGTAGGGLNLLSLRTGNFTHFTSSNNPRSLSSNYVSAITRGSDNNLWIGTWGGGVNVMKYKNGDYAIERMIPTPTNYSNELVNAFTSCLVDDPRGFLLVGTEGGLSAIDYNNKHIFTLVTDDDVPALNEIGCALLDSKGNYWIGTRNGLFCFPQSSVRETRDDTLILNHVKYFTHDLNDINSLPNDYIISLLEDSKGNIWVGTYGKGLARASLQEDQSLYATNFDYSNGLSNNVVYGMQEDKTGRLWIITDYGISVYNPKTNTFRRFFKEDGLLSNQFYWSASYKNKSGTMYFGGVDGLNYFDPNAITEHGYANHPKLTKFRIYNTDIYPGDISHNIKVLNKPIYAVDTIRLSYKDNNFSFDFSAFDYYLPAKTNFKYMLSGIDKKYMEVTPERRYANYNNIPGGKYTFMLKSTNCDGIWNNTPYKVTIIVTPPFWKTTWFNLLSIALLVILILLTIRWQMNRIIAQKKILEEKVRSRTKKIEDQKVILEKQAHELKENNEQLEYRQSQIEQQKEELEAKNEEISSQRDELITLNQKVNEINQLQLRFFTNISHEFRTPLTLIISPIERLMKLFEKDNDAGYLLNIINRNANRLLILIRQLLEIRKIETGNQNLQVELTDTKDYILGIFHSFDELAQKHYIAYTPQLNVNYTAWIDKEKLENVLYNLLSNAFRFTPNGNSITLIATSFKKEDQDYLKIAVKDTGEGIAPEQMEKLFDRFLQVTESRKHKKAGTGIGLSMVKSLVSIMHGKIDLLSEKDKGSEFIITLPVSKNAFTEDEIDTTGQKFESNIQNRVAVLYEQITDTPVSKYIQDDTNIEKIVVIEDNPDMRSFICSNLAPYFQVIEAENGAIGYELIKKEHPSLILSDIMMPEMSGTELCKKVKSNLYTSHIPVILLTAKAKIEDQVEGLEFGADDYVTKPFNIEVLLAKVNSLIEIRNKLRVKYSKLEEVDTNELTISTLDSEFFEKANTIVEKYYSDSSFDVDQFASEMFVSRSQLYSKLKAITNLSANEFINSYRLKKAMELLKAGNKQISEIAYSIGFNDPKYFSRIFKKFYNCSPSDLLKKG